ncbi:Hypothetical protein SMAX5B_019504 [Scophthalmus maximus]|uniref:Uncharacterized protein n=1 Tax=Scophthalmus maximus TaxID=52904 RepID=A0A2U9BHZ6_SCOMX|nr:Hypothetical protein SMAX5B_019504 [Scophthalmus maximus]
MEVVAIIDSKTEDGNKNINFQFLRTLAKSEKIFDFLYRRGREKPAALEKLSPCSWTAAHEADDARHDVLRDRVLDEAEVTWSCCWGGDAGCSGR